jgi:alkyldihydroxyacetonephosphate synthase
MHIEKLANAIGPERVSVDAEALNAHRFDRWCLKHWQDWQGETLPTPGCVVRPESTEEVQALMRHATEHGIAVIPWGLGSGVCGGIEPSDDQILLDMSAMNQVIEIDEENLLLTVQAGINGLVAEEAVAERGLTMGHWPQSIGISSVGGWVSTRASGQFSTAYGNIEDIVYTMDFVLASGEKVTLGKAPRAASGPDLRHLALGAEGTHGVVTSVTLSLRRQPESRQFSAWYCADMATGFRAQREIIQQDWKPPVMRQYDASEVARLFPDHERGDSGLILLVHEGPAARVEAEMHAIQDIMTGLGLAAADAAAAANWMGHRNNVPEWRDLLDQGLIADTIEVSGSWSQIDAIYTDVVAALKAVPDCVNASAHSSHVYRSGINLYFTFACMPSDTQMMGDRYLDSWDRALTATAQAGGGIAHHHGSGRLRRDYLHHDLGESGVALLRTVKNALDPQGILNPGNLLPPLSDH